MKDIIKKYKTFICICKNWKHGIIFIKLECYLKDIFKNISFKKIFYFSLVLILIRFGISKFYLEKRKDK